MYRATTTTVQNSVQALRALATGTVLVDERGNVFQRPASDLGCRTLYVAE